jgi:AcrR family transcriptional regulator
VKPWAVPPLQNLPIIQTGHMVMDRETNSKECVKKQIIEQAVEILINEGFKALNIDNIVKKCNLSKTTFYKHFNSKEALLEAVREQKNNNTDIITQRDAILAKASEAFFRLGVDAINMASIAKASGINRPSLYRYFSSKEELLEYAVRYEIKSRQAALTAIKDQTDDPQKQLELLLETTYNPSHQHYDTLMLVTSRYKLYKNRKIRKYFYELVQNTIEMLTGIFANGIATGLFKKEIDPHMMAVMFLALFNGIGFNHEHDQINLPNDIKKSVFDLLKQFIKED